MEGVVAVVAAPPSTVVAGLPVPLAGLGRAVTAVCPPGAIAGPAIRRWAAVGAAGITRG